MDPYFSEIDVYIKGIGGCLILMDHFFLEGVIQANSTTEFINPSESGVDNLDVLVSNGDLGTQQH
jgi:hypothetical protein